MANALDLSRELFTRNGGLEAHSGSTFQWTNGYTMFGAQKSDARGELLLPDKRTEVAFSSGERTILALKSRLLVENYGPAGALRKLAQLVGPLKLQADSGDPKWDALAEGWFNRVTESPMLFDAGGRYNLASYQTRCLFRSWVEGDCFTVLTASQSGRAQVKGYDGLCVETAPKQLPPAWIDGVLCDIRTGFPLGYSFRERDAKNKPFYRVLEGSKVIHNANHWTFAARRGVPALAHALNNFQDLLESDAFVKQAIKVASMIGITRKADPGPGPPVNFGVGSPLQRSTFTPPTATETTTTLPLPTQTFEHAIEGGIVSTAPFEALHDARPHPNFMAYKEALFRETAWGIGFPPQLLFWMDDPGGAWTRTILDDAAKTIAGYHANFLGPMVKRLWAHTIALGIKRGDVEAPQRGNWLKLRLTPPRNITADLGKIGKLNIELRRSLQTTFSHLYEELGMDWESELDQCGREFAYLMQLETKYGLPEGAMTHALLPQQAAASMFAPEQPAKPGQAAE